MDLRDAVKTAVEFTSYHPISTGLAAYFLMRELGIALGNRASDQEEKFRNPLAKDGIALAAKLNPPKIRMRLFCEINLPTFTRGADAMKAKIRHIAH